MTTSLPATATDFSESRDFRATDMIAAACGYALRLAIGTVIIAAPLAFVTLHRSPLPEEALVIAAAAWPVPGDQPTADRFAQ